MATPNMSDTTKIASIVGPTLIAVAATENPFVNPHLYDLQIPPVVYISGTLFFVGGVSIVRMHNVWRRDWSTVVTLVGWAAIAVGILRMTFPHAHIEAVDASSLEIIVVESCVFATGIFLTYKAYFSGSGRGKQKNPEKG